ncbi:ribbon-helix-helix protein, CopG family, partial [bacterium]|nr:ribbon-helix-helix protein, CopG family [bacterium]
MARILVSMPDDFLKSIDKIALTEQRTRSELVREALRSYMKKAS